MGEEFDGRGGVYIPDVSHCGKTVATLLTAQDQLIDVFKSVGQVVDFRCV